MCVVTVLASGVSLMGSSGGSSLRVNSLLMCLRVGSLRVPVLLMTIGMISISWGHAPWVRMASLRGVYLSRMDWATVWKFSSVEYLHSIYWSLGVCL